MSQVRIFCPNPYGLSFVRWASILTEQLARYNVPGPGNEGSWLQWATQVYANPILTGQGVSDPRRFKTWRDWAANIMQVAS